MKRHISKDTLEHYLNTVESAVRDSFPVNSSVVSNFGEIMRLALKGYELESAGQADAPTSLEPCSIPQLGIR